MSKSKTILGRPPVNPSDFNPQVLSVIGFMYHIQADLFDAQRDIWHKDGLTLRSATIVILINNGFDRPNQLREYFNVLPSTVSFDINKLVNRGLVLREAISDDARAVRFKLTPEGKKRHDRMLQVVNKFMGERISSLKKGEFEKFLEIGLKIANYGKR